jgi:Zn-dependent membrane protease YugP
MNWAKQALKNGMATLLTVVILIVGVAVLIIIGATIGGLALLGTILFYSAIVFIIVRLSMDGSKPKKKNEGP